MHVLVIDIGGSSVKVFGSGQRCSFTIPSGPDLTPAWLISQIRQGVAGWKFDVVSIGYPGEVKNNAPAEDAPNLGRGWVKFDFAKAFKRRVRFLNDAAMQALGSYRGGRMLFLGLGTGLGSTLILESIVHAIELGDLTYRNNKSYADYLGKAGLKRLGTAAWQRHVKCAVHKLKAALRVDYVVLGGGQAERVFKLPAGVLRGDNTKAFEGGVRVWKSSLRPHGPRLAFS